MNKKTAEHLWQTILSYGEARQEIGNVGNSGEFYTDREANAAQKQLAKSEEGLVEAFTDATGWYPDRSQDKDHNDVWTLKKYHQT